MRKALRILGANERGATVVEFAFIAPIMLLLLAGGIELGRMVYMESVFRSAAVDAARDASLNNIDTPAELQTAVKNELSAFNVTIDLPTVVNSDTFAGKVGNPEAVKYNAAPYSGSPKTGDCYYDVNGNKQWDSNVTSWRDGFGGAEDVVNLRITGSYPLLFPFLTSWTFLQKDSSGKSVVKAGNPFGADSTGKLRVATEVTIRNEPFGIGFDSQRCLCPSVNPNCNGDGVPT